MPAEWNSDYGYTNLNQFCTMSFFTSLSYSTDILILELHQRQTNKKGLVFLLKLPSLITRLQRYHLLFIHPSLGKLNFLLLLSKCKQDYFRQIFKTATVRTFQKNSLLSLCVRPLSFRVVSTD